MGNDNVKDYPPYLDYQKPRKPITNANKLRSMSDEELAEYLANICYDFWALFDDDPKKAWLDWLKQEANG